MLAAAVGVNDSWSQMKRRKVNLIRANKTFCIHSCAQRSRLCGKSAYHRCRAHNSRKTIPGGGYLFSFFYAILLTSPWKQHFPLTAAIVIYLRDNKLLDSKCLTNTKITIVSQFH